MRQGGRHVNVGYGRPVSAANVAGNESPIFRGPWPVRQLPAPQLPIQKLISDRCQVLGLKRADFIRRCGFKNEAKGYRRLDALLAGDFNSSRGLIAGLPAALEIPAYVVMKAIEESKTQISAVKDFQWRSEFKPHAIILTERKVPEPIFIAAMIGVERLLRIDFDLNQGSLTFVQQAIEGVRCKLSEWNGLALPAFGRPIGFVVNYSPDRAVKFDMTGKADETFPKAYCIGQALLLIGGRPFEGLK